MTAYLSALALVIVGAFITRNVWLLGYHAGVALERSRQSLLRGAAAMEAAVNELEKSHDA